MYGCILVNIHTHIHHFLCVCLSHRSKSFPNNIGAQQRGETYTHITKETKTKRQKCMYVFICMNIYMHHACDLSHIPQQAAPKQHHCIAKGRAFCQLLLLARLSQFQCIYVNMFESVCVWVHVCNSVYVNIYINPPWEVVTHVYIYNMYICVYTYIYICKYTYMKMYTTTFQYICMYTDTSKYTHTYMDIYMYICINTYIYIYIYIYMYVYLYE